MVVEELVLVAPALRIVKIVEPDARQAADVCSTKWNGALDQNVVHVVINRPVCPAKRQVDVIPLIRIKWRPVAKRRVLVESHPFVTHEERYGSLAPVGASTKNHIGSGGIDATPADGEAHRVRRQF